MNVKNNKIFYNNTILFGRILKLYYYRIFDYFLHTYNIVILIWPYRKYNRKFLNNLNSQNSLKYGLAYKIPILA